MSDFTEAYAQWRHGQARLETLTKLFIVGCGKSGTNWLKNLLNGHEQIVVRGEGRFFWQYAPILGEAIKVFNAELPWPGEHITKLRDFELQLLLRTTIDNQLARYVADAGARPGLRVVGDKTPMHALAIGKLHTLYPDARFVHIVRDPRDVTTSQWLFWARENDSRSLEEFVRYSITRVWPLNVRTAREAGRKIGPARYAEVRYEDLHIDVAAELERILCFLDVDADPETIRQCAEAGSFHRFSGGRSRGESAEGDLYRSGVVGDWRNHLPEDLVTTCCAEIAPLMADFGYDPRESRAPVDGVVRTADGSP